MVAQTEVVVNNLPELIRSLRFQLEALRESWLKNGATCYCLRDMHKPLLQHAECTALEDTCPRAKITLKGKPIGELRVYGLNIHDECQTRLEAEANLLSNLLELESELEAMTYELVEKQDQLVALYELTRSMRNRLTVDEVLKALCHETSRFVPSAGVFALVQLPDGKTYFTSYGSSILGQSTAVELLAEAKAANCEVMVKNDLPGFDNLIFVPISIRDEQIAGLGLVNKSGGFSSPDQKLTYAIVQQGGAQIENVVLYEETLSQAIYKSELEIAARIQSRLLPQSLPTVKGLDIATYSRPARHVGGDLYGLVTQKDRPFMFMVGDVSGKGTSAAMMMSMARILLQSSARFLPNPSPEIVLDRTNQDLYQDCTELRMFLTAFVGSYHPEKNEITYANAGHSPVIFCPAGGPAVLLEADGPPVGVLNKFISELMHLPFEEGDVLVVATDGLNEASDPDGELFGYEGLYKLIEELSPLPAQAIVEGLMKAIDKFSAGHPQDDDQTLLVIKGVAQ